MWLLPAHKPIAILQPTVCALDPAQAPIDILALPVVEPPAAFPIAIFVPPVVKAALAAQPIPIL